MPANFQALQDEINRLTQQVQSTETVEQSAIALLNGFADAIKKAVTAALAADDAADQGSIDTAMAAIKTTTDRFTASGSALGAAVVANTPNA